MDLEPGTPILENGVVKGSLRHGRTAHNVSSSTLRKRSDLALVSKVRFGCLRVFLVNLQEVILGTRICVLFPAIPAAILAASFGFGRPWVFVLSLLGLAPLAERLSFLTEQISYFTGPTVGGLLNATCGNATELIIAIFALSKHKIELVKYSLVGSVLSNLLLVLGSSLFFGGIVNLKKEQIYDRRQAEVNSQMLLLALLCFSLPLLFRYAGASADVAGVGRLRLSRAGSIVMLVAYFAYLSFQLLPHHRQLFEEDKEPYEYDDDVVEEVPTIGMWSTVAWLVIVTIIVALLSEYVVATIEVPLCVIVAWVMGMNMDLDFNILQTASLALSIMASSSILQEGTSHYLKGLILLLFYVVIATCFFLTNEDITIVNSETSNA